ncbi:SDR family oxidoreductase [Pseudomonas citronellolis]|uniref:SDR family oxidoreductase n=1 Tax=Pseudomonas citronellolis TaxID=53408 RepID=UPI0023E471E3|nr:SDR family oxidoreductase [Pseudomonas citronellolis]MDF3935175.1 SDR family oxidoreductase [Pseudomonas citronellolis]
MTRALDFSGQVVLVTGGAKGVGRGISQRFLEHGAEVVICGREAPVQLPSHDGREAWFVPCDVRDFAQLEALLAAIDERHGRLDVLVNNAGGAPYADAADASPRFSEAIVRLNLLAPLNLCQLANQRMQKQPGGGAIINICSVSATRPSPGTAAYGAAKAGLLNLGRSLAVEWAPKVRVNAVIGGLIRTEQSHLHYGDEAGLQRVASTVPLGRLAEPGDIGDACLYLASPLAAYVSGAELALHGGGERPAFLDAAQG